ncbi:hypothetical protein [Varibaculum cambriense]|uniref:hypothetical protein n=1 Tax=Varibaculum cambriense TaxID=184870 RepID=UPI002904BB15|nr:hypothetical protein [Varibaculum cambriense]MDU1225126.1 hypothetical protein [Varibaculum cambriense]
MSEKLLTMETARARATDPSTSSLAAETVPVNRHMGYVLAAARSMDNHSAPFTDEDLTTYLHMTGRALTEQSVRSRRAEAVRHGWIKVIDRDGVSSTGRACRRYEITPAGVEALNRAKTEAEWKAERRRAS